MLTASKWENLIFIIQYSVSRTENNHNTYMYAQANDLQLN